jgi:hypothetical protein
MLNPWVHFSKNLLQSNMCLYSVLESYLNHGCCPEEKTSCSAVNGMFVPTQIHVEILTASVGLEVVIHMCGALMSVISVLIGRDTGESAASLSLLSATLGHIQKVPPVDQEGTLTRHWVSQSLDLTLPAIRT